MRDITTIEELLIKIECSKNRIIYGAGWSGKVISKFLRRRGVPITAFAVTVQDQRYELEGTLEQGQLENTLLILAAIPPNRYTMEKELENRGVIDYVEFADQLLYEMLRENQKMEAKSYKSQIKFCQTVGFLSPGYFDTDYAEQRLIINKIEDIHYAALPKETVDLEEISIRKEANLETYRMLSEACYYPSSYVPNVDFIHTFNTVCITDKPWCVLFETVIPRVWDENEGERQFYLKEEFDKKHDVKEIHFIFIGKAFFIKGGREVIQALSKFENRYDFRLTLISSLQYGDYFTKTSYEEMERCKEIIRSKKWIDHYEALPNIEVIEKCREATIGMFPSLADTYGYAVLEMQAAGCTVITTNIRAFPEINNEECG
ncbi:hypothetical protein IMSAGC018_02009 [Lachnospiraceae bacterium]|nr:hypothetical protein IMSAGC018_02009 [Lachnospiraceae bacterium]